MKAALGIEHYGLGVALIIEPDHVHYSKQPFEHEKFA